MRFLRRTANHSPGMFIFVAIAILILILAPLVFATTHALGPRWLATMALVWWLPGALLVAHWRLPELDLPTAGVLAAGLGLCWMALLALLLHWLPGPISLWLLLATFEVGALILLVALVWRRPVPLRPTPVATWRWMLLLLLLALLLRLPGLGYHELHSDEAFVLRPARAAIQGEDDALSRQTKGPGQIAIALVSYRALGTANETTARLPFALMGVAAVFATALFGRRLFSPSAGFWAGVLLALNGFALALSRLVQYQPVVILLSVLAVLSAWEFAQGGKGRWLALAALFSAFGIVMHYECGLLAPVLLTLTWMGWKRASSRRQILLTVLAAGVAGTALVAATYLPILLGSNVSRTQDYLGTRLGGVGAFNVGFFLEMGTFYNSSYFFFGLCLLVLIGLWLGWRTARQATLMLVLWFTPFLALHLFVMRFPGTHFYQFMACWSLLAALPLVAVMRPRFSSPLIRWSLRVLVVLWLSVSAGYLYLMFFQQDPEYLVNYDEQRVPFYWAPYGENVPEKPRFGFPIHEGWKTAGVLGNWGCYGLTWASNERAHSLGTWYLDGYRRQKFDREPKYFFIATHLQELDPLYSPSYLEGYQRAGEVRVRNEPRIEIWARDPLPASYVSFDAEAFAQVFDWVVPPLDGQPDPPLQVQGLVLGDAMVLESASLNRTDLRAGEVLHLHLVWQPQQALATDYKLFVHVADENGQPLAQWDGFPCLNTMRTSEWLVSEPVDDHVLLTIPEEMPLGEYPVLIGFYDPATGERLAGQSLKLATITIR